MLKFFEMFRKNRLLQTESPEKAAFQYKYKHFQNLLAGNSRALEIMTELEQTCYGPKPFALDDVVDRTANLESRVYDIIEDLNALAGGAFPGLFDALERVGESIRRELTRKKGPEETSLTIPLQHLSLDRVSEVGGKAANLGEIYNRIHLPVPRGFAVTAHACSLFLESNDLFKRFGGILKGLDVENTSRLLECSREIRAAIVNAVLPAELERCLMEEVAALTVEFGSGIGFAVRSSATSEDSEASFAGQHSTVLGVGRDRIVQAYKEVVASTFNPRAVYYRRTKGYPDEYVMMSVLCVVMVDAGAGGVMYTRDPNNPGRDVLMINAVWGLGVGAVDGSAATDFYEVDKSDRRLLASHVAEKPTRFVIGPDWKPEEQPVPEELRCKACLNPDQLMLLAEYGLTIESHYGVPMDIEWALDSRGRLILLQARPLNVELTGMRGDQAAADQDPGSIERAVAAHAVVLRGGMTASRGKASGFAYVLNSDHNLLNVPEDAILIARQTSPRYVAILGRARAIVTDVGSVTGHMAAVAREFGVPALVGTGNATEVIGHGVEVTVDATNRLVFKGRVESILGRKRQVNPMKGSPVYRIAHSVLKRIAVLNLVDPKSDQFSPEGCQTLHDIIRFAHEASMREMFRISDDLDVNRSFAVRIKAPLPMKIFAVDLGNGLSIQPGTPEARVEDVASVPFRALLRGMTRPDVRWIGPVDVNWKGFAAIVTESIFSDPTLDDRMGGPNYVVISGEYLNFNSRLGYHFAVVDSYCGENVNDNYITFSFKGGAADIGRRSRRALLITKILKRLGFKTEMKGDLVRGELKKFQSGVIEEKLDMIGRLLGAVRLLDMVLSDDGHIDWYVEEFLKGNYTFQRPLRQRT